MLAPISSRTALRAPSAPTRKRERTPSSSPDASRRIEVTPSPSSSALWKARLKRRSTLGSVEARSRSTASSLYCGIHWACSGKASSRTGAALKPFWMRASPWPASRVTKCTS